MYLKLMEKQAWTKTVKGYSTTETKYGAIVDLHTDKNLTDADLAKFLVKFYQIFDGELKNGGHYALFPKGLEW